MVLVVAFAIAIAIAGLVTVVDLVVAGFDARR